MNKIRVECLYTSHRDDSSKRSFKRINTYCTINKYISYLKKNDRKNKTEKIEKN